MLPKVLFDSLPLQSKEKTCTTDLVVKRYVEFFTLKYLHTIKGYLIQFKYLHASKVILLQSIDKTEVLLLTSINEI